MARALEANGAAAVYIVGRRLEALEAAVKQSVRQPPNLSWSQYRSRQLSNMAEWFLCKVT